MTERTRQYGAHIILGEVGIPVTRAAGQVLGVETGMMGVTTRRRFGMQAFAVVVSAGTAPSPDHVLAIAFGRDPLQILRPVVTRDVVDVVNNVAWGPRTNECLSYQMMHSLHTQRGVRTRTQSYAQVAAAHDRGLANPSGTGTDAIAVTSHPTEIRHRIPAFVANNRTPLFKHNPTPQADSQADYTICAAN